MSEEKLRNCPFCGGQAYANETDWKGWWHGWVICEKCGVKIDKQTKDEAIEAWNKRVADDGKTLTCFKCHGAGVYGVPYLDDNGEWNGRLDVRRCEVCGHTGKITLALYEKWQKRMREDKE